VFGLGYFGARRFGEVKGLRRLSIPTISYMFKPQNDLNRKLKWCRVNRVGLILSPDPDFEEYGKVAGCRARLFMYGCDSTVFRDRGEKRDIDFGFSGALHGSKHYVSGAFTSVDLRQRVQELLFARRDLNCFLNGSDSITPRIKSQDEYARLIGNAKIWLSTPAAFGDMPPRYLEVGMSRTLILTTTVPSVYRDVYLDGHNCVQFKDDLSDFREKVDFYLCNDSERQRIAGNACVEFHAKYTWRHRAEEIISIVKDLWR